MILSAALALLAAAPAGRCAEVVAISDLHGRIEALPAVAAEVAALRRRGPTLVLDAGDSLQGTIEASLSRGAAVVAGYAALGLDAAAVGNHDFDGGQDVLRARAVEAPYPFLAANVRVKATGERLAWRNVRPRVVLRPRGGPAVGVFGLSGEDTPWITLPRNVEGLAFGSAAREAREQAAALRAEGAEAVVALVHIGGRCGDLSSPPDDLASCDLGSDLFRLVGRLEAGTVDAVVAGHTHALVAKVVNGIAVVQAGARAEWLGRLTVCAGAPARPGRFVRVSSIRGRERRVEAAVAPFVAAARAERERPIGVTLAAPLTRDRRALSPFGAAAAASLRAALGSDFALVNAGALRLDLPAGELTYGRVYEALPFDDDLVVFRLRGRDVEALLGAVARNGFPQVVGLRYGPGGARTCAGAALDDERPYTLATNEFVASGGDGVRSALAGLGASATYHPEKQLREVFIEWLRTAAPDRLSAPCP